MPPCPAPDTCWCYLIRHGATAHNLAQPSRLQGRRLDDPLCADGRRQAEQTAALLARAGLGAVYTSPLVRARQTAELVAAPHGLSAEPVEDLIEVDVGDWEGLTWDEIERDWPEAARAFLADAGLHGYLGGEDLRDVRDRVVPAMGRLAGENLGRSIAVVAHNVVNRCFLTHVLGIPVSQYRLITQDNCGVSLLRFWEGKTKIVTMNAVFHLDTQAP